MSNGLKTKMLCVQLQPELLSVDVDVAEIDALLGAMIRQDSVANLTVEEGFDDGGYINYVFETPDAEKLWQTLRLAVLDDSLVGMVIQEASVVTCEGQHGWDDYLLLHHYDDEERVDSFETVVQQVSRREHTLH